MYPLTTVRLDERPQLRRVWRSRAHRGHGQSGHRIARRGILLVFRRRFGCRADSVAGRAAATNGPHRRVGRHAPLLERLFERRSQLEGARAHSALAHLVGANLASEHGLDDHIEAARGGSGREARAPNLPALPYKRLTRAKWARRQHPIDNEVGNRVGELIWRHFVGDKALIVDLPDHLVDPLGATDARLRELERLLERLRQLDLVVPPKPLEALEGGRPTRPLPRAAQGVVPVHVKAVVEGRPHLQRRRGWVGAGCR
eukprot:scaffold105707_cov25-Tisochrysis_lutea.AAC.1